MKEEKMEQGRVAVLVNSPSSHCEKHAYQVWIHMNLFWQSHTPDKKCSLKINQWKIIQKQNKEELRFLCPELWLLPETCILSLKPYESMVTKFRSGHEMLFKNQSKGNN